MAPKVHVSGSTKKKKLSEVELKDLAIKRLEERLRKPPQFDLVQPRKIYANNRPGLHESFIVVLGVPQSPDSTRQITVHPAMGIHALGQDAWVGTDSSLMPILIGNAEEDLKHFDQLRRSRIYDELKRKDYYDVSVDQDGRHIIKYPDKIVADVLSEVNMEVPGALSVEDRTKLGVAEGNVTLPSDVQLMITKCVEKGQNPDLRAASLIAIKTALQQGESKSAIDEIARQYQKQDFATSEELSEWKTQRSAFDALPEEEKKKARTGKHKPTGFPPRPKESIYKIEFYYPNSIIKIGSEFRKMANDEELIARHMKEFISEGAIGDSRGQYNTPQIAIPYLSGIKTGEQAKNKFYQNLISQSVKLFGAYTGGNTTVPPPCEPPSASEGAEGERE